jgi:hypothetical protein
MAYNSNSTIKIATSVAEAEESSSPKNVGTYGDIVGYSRNLQ